MTRLGGMVLLLCAAPAWAGEPLLTARSRVDDSQVSLVLALQSFGAGWLHRSDADDSALGAELTYAPVDGVGELRGARQWQLTDPARLLSASLQVGVSSYLVLKGPVDFGMGPNVGLFAGLGGGGWEVWTGAQAGAEAFLRTGGPRLPLRGLLGARGRVGDFGASLTARGGVDFDPRYAVTWRGDVLLTVGWYGLPD